jgi:hypothetical protein
VRWTLGCWRLTFALTKYSGHSEVGQREREREGLVDAILLGKTHVVAIDGVHILNKKKKISFFFLAFDFLSERFVYFSSRKKRGRD